jgi:putative riboflavin transport system substrate-binding protein
MGRIAKKIQISRLSHSRSDHFAGRRALLGITLAATVALAGCSVAATPQASPPRLTTVTIVMGYVPNIQFAPFYVAQKLGYYKAAGLKVRFNFNTEPNALQQLSQGSVQFVDSGGDEVLTAGAHGLHVRYVMTQYSRFPAALFFLKTSHLKKVADLRGKKVGIPAAYGASYYGLLALLHANHVPASAVSVQTIGYTQLAAVASGQVTAAMGYAPNEPVALRAQGKPTGEFDVYKWANLAGAGVATSDMLIKKHPSVVRGFVGATLKGLRYALKHPASTFSISKASIPGFTNDALQRQVLSRVITFWKPAKVKLGHMDPGVWNLTAKVLYQFKQIPHKVNAAPYYTNRFVP